MSQNFNFQILKSSSPGHFLCTALGGFKWVLSIFDFFNPFGTEI